MTIKAWYKAAEFTNQRDEWRIHLPAVTVSNWDQYEIELPDGFVLLESNGGTMEIYDRDGNHCVLCNGNDGKPRPRLLTGSGRGTIALNLVGEA